MKLLSCHIENYGTHSNVDYKFDEKLTQFFWGNGQGKTTLSSFIKAMFFGLPSSTGRTKFNERQHFYPFNGGKFGGNLTYEQGGKIYRIERFFDKNSDTRDELRVYCDGKTLSLGEDIGKAVFGIDEEAFIRTAFISADEIEIASTSSINAKLKNFVDSTEGEVGYAEAVEALEKAGKNLKAARGSNDEISRQKERILKLQSEVANYSSIESGLDDRYENRRSLAAEVESLDVRSKAEYEAKIEFQKWEYYDSQLNDIATKESRKKQLEGLPSEKNLDELQKKITLSNTLRAEIDSLGARSDERLQTLKSKFQKNLPTDGQVEAIKSEVEEYKDKQQKLRNLPAVAASAESSKTVGKNYKIIIIAAAVFSVLLLLGGVGAVFANLIAGIILMVAGFLALGATGFLYFNAKMKRVERSQPVQINEESLKLQDESERLKESVVAYLASYGYYTDNGIVFDFAKFCEDLSEYRQGIEKEHAAESELQKKNVEYERLAGEVKAYLSKFGEDGFVLQNSLNNLRAKAGEYGMLVSEIEQLKRRAEDYKNNNGLTDRPRNMPEILDVSEELNQKRQLLARLDRIIEEDEKTVEWLSEKRAQLDEANERLDYLKKRHALITAAKNKLVQAEHNLTEKYIAPVKDGFLKYSELLEKSLGEKITMDKDFRISFERGGENRSDKHLSAGQRAICMLCFRLALIDNMYEGEKPFIIMDDPFVALDSEHMKSAAELMKLLSADKQIIYFCCHDSRAVANK